MRVLVLKKYPSCSLALLLAIFACSDQTSTQDKPSEAPDSGATLRKKLLKQPVTLEAPAEFPKRTRPHRAQIRANCDHEHLEGGFVRAVGRELVCIISGGETSTCLVGKP